MHKNETADTAAMQSPVLNPDSEKLTITLIHTPHEIEKQRIRHIGIKKA